MKYPWIGRAVLQGNFVGIFFGEIVPNRATERARDAKGAISEIAESISCVFSIGGNSSTPPASTILSLLQSTTIGCLLAESCQRSAVEDLPPPHLGGSGLDYLEVVGPLPGKMSYAKGGNKATDHWQTRARCPSAGLFARS